jgi:hypothetical protein
MVSIEIFHNNPSINNLTDFANEHQIVINSDFSIQDFFKFEGNDQRIKQSYSIFPIPEETASPQRLESPVLIKVPVDRINKEIMLTESKNLVVVNKNFKVFWSKEIEKILKNNRFKISKNNQKQKVQFNVFLYSKTLESLIDISDFIESISTNVAENGGNFNIKISPITGYFDKDLNLKFNNLTQNTDFIHKSSIHKNEKGERNLFFFNLAIQTNDVIFIQFDKAKTISDESYKISFAELAENDFDMIGLVDSNSVSYSAENVEVSIDISGRDLIKLIIEDGAYFFPLDFAKNNNGFINGDSRSFKRLVDGQLEFFNAYLDRTIEQSIKFIFNQLSNIKVVTKDLFKFYKESVTTYEINDKNYIEKHVEGIWQCVRLVFDEEIQKRRIVDSSITTDSGSLLNFVNKVCQKPFVDFFCDTYGDKFYFIIRKPPFTGFSINSYKQNDLIIDIEEEDIHNEQFNFDDSEVYSWYRLIPRGNFFGDSDNISLVEFPAVYFQEYAEIWGSRPLQQVSNYIDYFGLSSSNNKVNLEYLKEQSLQDLSFLIEINCYLPFTRKGSITINGDRRIKRGCFIRHKGTKEIFHVDSVSQSAFSNTSVDRTTQINVSRGMVERFTNLNEKFNYFNIINLNKDKSGKSTDINFKVNKEVFDFFLKRKQFQ